MSRQFFLEKKKHKRKYSDKVFSIEIVYAIEKFQENVLLEDGIVIRLKNGKIRNELLLIASLHL